jgi:hypothetical protein
MIIIWNSEEKEGFLPDTALTDIFTTEKECVYTVVPTQSLHLFKVNPSLSCTSGNTDPRLPCFQSFVHLEFNYRIMPAASKSEKSARLFHDTGRRRWPAKDK